MELENQEHPPCWYLADPNKLLGVVNLFTIRKHERAVSLGYYSSRLLPDGMPVAAAPGLSPASCQFSASRVRIKLPTVMR